jgi:hypothetical protein
MTGYNKRSADPRAQQHRLASVARMQHVLHRGYMVNDRWPWMDKPHGLMNLGVLLLRLADQSTTRP